MTLQFTFGLLLIFQARQQVKEWVKTEAISCNFESLKKLKQDYHTAYYKSKGKPTGQKKLIHRIQYLLIRLSFIFPVYLPPLSECYLRRDFNFANYLAMALSKTLSTFFSTSLVSFFVLFLLACSFNSQDIKEAENALSLAITGLFFLVYFSVFYFLRKKVIAKLQPEVDNVEEMNFEAELD
jgi:hypothetical protein